jgi:uncharacterized protein
MHIFYLHGFASSARSSKATYLAARLRSYRLVLHTPDFNQPDFSTLTITRMVDQTVAAIDALPDGPIVLIGSSLGGFVAVQVALVRSSRVAKLVLLAPALDFGPSASSGPSRPFDSAHGRPEPVEGRAESRDGGNRMRTLGNTSVEEWKRNNALPVFHYGLGRMMTVHYGLYEDAARYDSVNAALSMPIQIFQGRQDDAVDPVGVEAWAKARPNVELHMLDDGHQLTGSLDYIWGKMKGFLELP